MDDNTHSIKFLNYLRSLKRKPMRDFYKIAKQANQTQRQSIETKPFNLASYRQQVSPGSDIG